MSVSPLLPPLLCRLPCPSRSSSSHLLLGICLYTPSLPTLLQLFYSPDLDSFNLWNPHRCWEGFNGRGISPQSAELAAWRLFHVGWVISCCALKCCKPSPSSASALVFSQISLLHHIMFPFPHAAGYFSLVQSANVNKCCTDFSLSICRLALIVRVRETWGRNTVHFFRFLCEERYLCL